MTVAITGASGTLGRLIAERLDDAVLITRDPSSLEGADVREGDFEDPSSLARAFEGVDRLLIISLPRVGERVPHHIAAVEAAAAAGVSHLLYTSITDPSDSNPAYVAAEHRATEDAMRASGLAWTFLRNSIYTEMLVPTAQ